MYYGTTQLATNLDAQTLTSWKVRVLKAVLFFVPRANPDIEKLYPLVRLWALEVADDGWPQREVALGASGNTLFRTPNDRNTGFWTDMAARQFQRSEILEISAQDFESMWSKSQEGSRSVA